MKKEFNWQEDHMYKNIKPLQCPNRIRLLRFEKGWSSGELGKKMGIARPTVLDYERGRTNIGSNVAKKLCEIFDVEIGDLHWRKNEREAMLKERKRDKDG